LLATRRFCYTEAVESDRIARSRESVDQFRRRHRVGLVTLLFTDIIGSTALKQRLGDASAISLIQQHHSAVRALIKQFPEGEEIDTAGDSFFVVFAKPSDAVKFSLLLQAKLRLLARESGYDVFDRIGVHVGEVFIDDQPDGSRSRDLFGLQVDTCARVMSLGDADQILLSRFAFDSARQVLKGEGITGIGPLLWLNHGTYALKGVDEPFEICEVGEKGNAKLSPPEDSEKAHRQVPIGDEAVLGWRPAVSQTVPGSEWILEKNLGEGGFGEVWLGRHKTLKQLRVFKFCFNADRVRSLKREVTIFRVLKEAVGDHPNITAIEDVFLDEPPFYIVMEYVEGENLIAWCTAQGGAEAVGIDTRLELIAQVADALQAAHKSGVIHRDIKPQNILIHQNAASPIAKLTDFGIGKVLSEEVLTGITRLGFTQTIESAGPQSGTQMYMAPEIISGKQPTKQSDIYSLGVVLYQLLVGDFTRPLTTDWEEEITDPLLRDDLRHCFSRNPNMRFAQAQELADRLRNMRERQEAFSREKAAVAARERTIRHRAQRRRRLALTAGCLAAIAAAASSILWLQNWTTRKQLAQLRDKLAVLATSPSSSPFELSTVSGRILALDAHDPKIWEVYCRALLDQGAVGQFSAALNRWRSSAPSTPEMEDLLGDFELKQGHPPLAVQHWLAFVQASTIGVQERVRTWTKLAQAYGQLGQWEQARNVLSDWIRAQDSVHARILRATANQQLRDWDAARDDLEFAEKTDPSNSEVKNFPRIKDLRAIEVLNERVNKTPRDPAAWVARARELEKNRKFESALEDINHALNLDPDSTRLAVEKAYLLWQLNRPIPNALKVRPSVTWTRNEAEFLSAHERFEAELEELGALDSSARVDGQSLDSYLLRGNKLAQMHQYSLAIGDYNRVLVVDPHSIKALQARAAAYSALGETQLAAEDLKRVEELH
jgi:class 3 adenylate cyclase/tetratricopeptide (TPR) repeat protein/tRNA A-37 threonylcarbamoyl transferase component Bud32